MLKYLEVKWHDICNLFSNGPEKKKLHTRGGAGWGGTNEAEC